MGICLSGGNDDGLSFALNKERANIESRQTKESAVILRMPGLERYER